MSSHAGRAQRYSPRPLTDGERWTAEALGRLRHRRYVPHAWLAFLRDSLQRSQSTRHARPVIARQACGWGAAGAGAWTLACAAARGHEDVRPRPVAGLLWWLLVWQMLDWHLGMAEGGDGRPRERLSPADAITLARFWLVGRRAARDRAADRRLRRAAALNGGAPLARMTAILAQ